MKQYTHNLHLLLCDNKNEVVDNDELLNQIKNKLISQDFNHWYISNGESISYTIRWIYIKPTTNETKKNRYLGDLFTNVSFHDDATLYKHIKRTIKLLEMNFIPDTSFRILFYLTRNTYHACPLDIS